MYRFLCSSILFIYDQLTSSFYGRMHLLICFTSAACVYVFLHSFIPSLMPSFIPSPIHVYKYLVNMYSTSMYSCVHSCVLAYQHFFSFPNKPAVIFSPRCAYQAADSAGFYKLRTVFFFRMSVVNLSKHRTVFKRKYICILRSLCVCDLVHHKKTYPIFVKSGAKQGIVTNKNGFGSDESSPLRITKSTIL